jgi:hypothetical protein
MSTKWTLEQQKANRATLVAALRSGEYTQGRYGLKCSKDAKKETFAFCCLGVACDVAIKAGIIPDWTVSEYGSCSIVTDMRTNYTDLPPEVQDWLGFQTAWGAFIDDTIPGSTLIDCNDNKTMDFNAIADVIEKEPVGLVVSA